MNSTAATVARSASQTQETKLPTSPSTVQPLLDAKDRRAYEVARQRAKRPEDRRKARDQKHKHVLAGAGRPRTADVVLDDAADAENVAREPLSLNTRALRSGEKAYAHAGETGYERPVTVRLEDLVRVAKVRKEKAGDFELIPHVRAVLALDDFDFAGDAKTEKFPAFDFDDWEHVESSGSSDEDDSAPKASYAQAVLSAMN